MSNRRAFLIWISINIKSERNFHLALPIPLLMLLGISDFLYDASIFIPNIYRQENERSISPGSAKQIVLAGAELLCELALHSEPFDIVDIDITEGQKRFAFQCKLR